MEILLRVWIDVDSIDDAEEIAHDIGEILDDSGIINSIIVEESI